MGKKRINGEGTFYYDKKRNIWQYRLVLGYDEDEKPIRKAYYGKTQHEAKAKGEHAKEELEGKAISVSPDMKFGAWLALYIENYKKGTVKTKWLDMLTGITKKIPTGLSRKKVSAVTPIELQKFINDLSGQYSKSYTQKAKILIKSALEEATDNGLCVNNPARKLTVPDKPEKPRESYTAEETGTIIQKATGYYNQTIAIGTVTMLLTGIRRGDGQVKHGLEFFC